MPLVSFAELMSEAERGKYAVGYFESWNLESLGAVADAAEAVRAPVLLGFSGIYLHHPRRQVHEPLSLYAALGNETCRNLKTSACLVFNESPHIERVLEAIKLGFGLVMYSDPSLGFSEQAERIKYICSEAHRGGGAVEGEMTSLPGMDGRLTGVPDAMLATDPEEAVRFVENTGIDAVAVNVGQAHLHGRAEVRLDLDRLARLNESLSVPLVLHSATSVSRQDLSAAIRLGVRKINVGSLMKTSYLVALRSYLHQLDADYNPYEVIGSGLNEDVLTQATVALQRVVEELMQLFGSAGKG
jgi:fructose/tagatose bisphosphate aldolase